MNGGQSAAPERVLPPYGPAKGMIEGLQLLQRSSPSKVDETLLRAQGIAPHNEYKVVGALRFLDLIDEHGLPTPRSRFLKTKGDAFKLHLQDTVRAAYADLFAVVPAGEATKEKIFNYFVTSAELAGEMATKATRFFIELCRLAEINLGPPKAPSRRADETRSVAVAPPTADLVQPKMRRETRTRREGPERVALPNMPFLLAITPDMARMDEEQLYSLFSKLTRVMRRVAEES